MFGFPSIARTAEGLGVTALGFPSCGHANDVVKFKIFSATTTRAKSVTPNAKLGSIETNPASNPSSFGFGNLNCPRIMRWKTPSPSVAIGPFAISLGIVSRHGDNSSGSSRAVTFLRTKPNGLTNGIGPFVERRPSFKIDAAHFTNTDDFTGFTKCWDDAGSPRFTKALHSAKFYCSALTFSGSVKSGRSFKRNATNLANGGDFRDGLWHVFPFQSNRVNSVKTSANRNSVFRYRIYTIPTKLAIPSQAANVRLKNPRVAEGVTTRGCGNNNPPKSARHQSIGEDIVWTSASNWHKRQKLVINKPTVTLSTYKRYSGYDVLNIAPSDVFTAAQFPIAQAAVAVSISGLEMMQNRGQEKMIDLLESRIGNAERTFQNNLSNDAYSNGTADGGKQIGGLQLLVAVVNNSGVIGGIDSGTWGFWQNAVQSFATNGLTPGAATMQTQMNRAWLAIARQADKPDLIVADNIYFRYYWESLQAIQRIQDERNAMAGFMNLKFMDADVVYDGGFQGNTAGNVSVLGGGGSWLSGTGAPASSMYFLNTDYLFLRPHADRNMVPLDPDRFSVNQDAMVKLIGWAGNMAISNRFLHCIVTA